MRKNVNLLRMFALVIALGLVFSASFIVSYATGGDKLYRYKFIKGSNPDEKVLNEDLGLTRVELAAIISQLYRAVEVAEFEVETPETNAKAKEELNQLLTQAEKVNLNTSYVDASNIPAWASPHVKFVTSMGLMSGLPGKKFAPEQRITGQQLAALMLRSMGYKDVDWANVPKKISEQGLKINMGAIRRGEAFDFIWDVLSKPVSADKTTLGVKLGVLTDTIISQEDALDAEPMYITEESLEFEPQGEDVREVIKGKNLLVAFSEYETLKITGNISSELKNFVYEYNDNVRKDMKERIKRVIGTGRMEAGFRGKDPEHSVTMKHIINYADNKMISFIQEHAIFMGGVVTRTYQAHNVDVKTGKLMKIKNRILNNTAFVNVIMNKMAEKFGENIVKPFGKFDKITKDTVVEKINKEGDYRFTLDDKGLNYYVSKYELSIGAIYGSVFIPYSELDGIFNYEGLY